MDDKIDGVIAPWIEPAERMVQGQRQIDHWPRTPEDSAEVPPRLDALVGKNMRRVVEDERAAKTVGVRGAASDNQQQRPPETPNRRGIVGANTPVPRMGRTSHISVSHPRQLTLPTPETTPCQKVKPHKGIAAAGVGNGKEVVPETRVAQRAHAPRFQRFCQVTALGSYSRAAGRWPGAEP
jgi:hypothetical protein